MEGVASNYLVFVSISIQLLLLYTISDDRFTVASLRELQDLDAICF